MATVPITVEVDEETARIYNNATPEERRKVAMLLDLQLADGFDRERNLQRLRALMDTVGQRAQEQGLTEDRLEEILREIDEERAGELTEKANHAESAQ